jgi:hypothetical protein
MSLSPASEESCAGLGLGPWWRRARGFRLCTRKCRFSVQRLRPKLLAFLGIIGRYARRLRSPLSTSSMRGGSPCPRSGSTRALVGSHRWYHSKGGETTAADEAPRRVVSFVRTNSYAQAVADCLEFIKRNSVPLQDYTSPVLVLAGGSGR